MDLVLLSQVYRFNVLVLFYDDACNLKEDILDFGFAPNYVRLSLINGTIDTVYPKWYIDRAGFCQSVLYGVLDTVLQDLSEEAADEPAFNLP